MRATALAMMRGWKRAAAGHGLIRLTGHLRNHRLELLRALHLL